MKKMIVAMTLLMSVSTAFASSLEDTALATLAASSDKVSLSGDVHDDETIASILNDAKDGGAELKNECQASAREAKCILWITYKPMGETALEYYVSTTGDQLTSGLVTVSRGD